MFLLGIRLRTRRDPLEVAILGNELDEKEAIHCEVTNKVIRMTAPGPGDNEPHWTLLQMRASYLGGNKPTEPSNFLNKLDCGNIKVNYSLGDRILTRVRLTNVGTLL